MSNLEEYRPKAIEFEVEHDGSIMPETFGEYKDADEALKFINSHLVTVSQGLTASRHMDQFEKKVIRNEYNDILENQIPKQEKDLLIVSSELSEVKKRESNAKEMLSASMNQVKMLAQEVKQGTKGLNLDEAYTFRVPYRGKYYFYTFIDKELKLCKIREIQESERSEIWNVMAGNEVFIDEQFDNGPTKEEKGTEK